MAPLIEAVDVKRVLGGESGGVAAKVINGVSLVVEPGEFVAVIGPSGSGKSTLLYLLGLLDRPTEGTVRFEGRSITEMADREIAKLRNEKIGFIFQFHFLLPEFTALENTVIPILAGGRVSRAQANKRGREILEHLDMAPHMGKRPNQLSGGQQQRVAIARALANRPLVIMGDEPTGNLDTKNSCAVFDIFERLNREEGQTVVLVTHDLELASRARRIVMVRDGLIHSDRLVTDKERSGGKCELS